ncbi:MAG: CoA-binding protein [Bacteroidetes bacterium]|nr:CoA-binding protein [Bacteroidota bacterium]
MLSKQNKITVVIGASPNEERYSYKACIKLSENGHTVYPLGVKNGSINHLEIITQRPIINNVNTVSLYINKNIQTTWENYIISLSPKRVIFNPGTENPEFEVKLKSQNIEIINACTLVMLSIGNY